ncbi:MAG: carbamoyl-phosphate synthase large subunit [Candidatus Hydrogenedentes bacterium]|nr:carbamoyl-phosphate synthase large subunit [Candidatus Hydrogenedentota bacterium]
MDMMNLLVANRGEIAIRVMRAAAELGMKTVAVFSEDDTQSLHTRKADEARPLRGSGPGAYLDIEQIIDLAKAAGCGAIHPGYGFLSENAAFARRCVEEGIVFVGPSAEILDLFGDKTKARALADRCGVPILPGTSGATSLDEARAFFETLGDDGTMMIKAVAGGGGRGMRVVRSADALAEAYARCQSEARGAFGIDAVYVEQFLSRARHIEVQIVGDGSGRVSHIWERECSIQRRNQKIVEISPSPGLATELRDRLIAAAVRMAEEVRYANLGTFEFLLDASKTGDSNDAPSFAFIEANPRLQVEHTVTEEVTGIDLVRTQLELASGRSLTELGLEQGDIPEPRGYAIQTRINMETMEADGTTRPSTGTISAFETPSGPGLRVDTFGYTGYTPSPRFDSLLAKLVAHSPSNNFADAVNRAYRGLCEFRIEGVSTNLPFLLNLLKHPEFGNGAVYTGFIDDHIEELTAVDDSHRRLYFSDRTTKESVSPGLVGAKVDTLDPLAILNHGKTGTAAPSASVAPPTAPPQDAPMIEGPPGTVPIGAPVQGTIVSINVHEGESVHAGQEIIVMEAMKMQHYITAQIGGVVRSIVVSVDDTVYENHPLVFIEEAEVKAVAQDRKQAVDLDYVRPDLAEVHERHGKGFDDARPGAVAKRRKTGHRTARENVDDLCDAGTFVEYGPLVIAAQRLRRSVEDLIENTPADGLVAGIGRVNGDRFDERASQCVILSYDYTVLAGTQGKRNHYKKDRMFELAEESKLPVVFFTEGGGGRPGDTDALGAIGLDCLAFTYFAKLSGLVPLVGITTGRCFAGNAVLLGCCDVIIATKDANIGIGGPAMIEGGGLGVFRPEEVGPMDVQVPNGVVDIPVADEAEAVRVAKQYLSYFQGSLDEWECPDQRLLRSIIPEDRLRIYDVREVIDTLADSGSVLEIRRHFGHGIITSFIRIEGRPVAVVANNPMHLAGAIDADGADKGARFMQLCDAFDIPILFLCDCPGIMVGPEAEKTALVRHASRMFVVGASVTVPFFTIVLRKGYGLGAQAMAGGSFRAPFFTVSWPTGEFGGMGLEGAVKLGYRKELEAVEDPTERKALYEKMVAEMYESGKAVNTATYFMIDDVIDPKDSRDWIMGALRSAPPPKPREGKKRPCIDTW